MDREPVFENMKVDYVDHMGSDLTIVNAARVSFDKTSDFEWEAMSDRNFQPPNDDEQLVGGAIRKLKEGDKRLIRFLATHDHWSPFGHAFMQFRVKAPVFVARQLVKHQVGLCWNEVSRRYVDSEPTYYHPENWRARDKNKKQGSKKDEFITELPITDGSENIHTMYRQHVKAQHNLYLKMIENGVAPEQARIVLPLSHMTEWYWSGSLMAFARTCNLRLDPHAQEEDKEVVKEFDRLASELFPVSWKYLTHKE